MQAEDPGLRTAPDRRKRVIRWLPVSIDGAAWLAEIYREGARQLGIRPLGSGRASGSDAVIAGPATHDGATAWLRVAAFIESDMDREVWTGTHDAASLSGVAKPTLLAETEWTHPDPVPVSVRAELLTFAADSTVVPADAYGAGQYLSGEPDLPDAWWGDLRASVDALADTPTERKLWAYSPEQIAHLIHARVGELPADVAPGPAATEHLDLHWGNITAPHFSIIDWEHWGRSVPGIGVANLYITALRHAPRTASRLRAAFPELDAPTGRYARVVACLFTLAGLSWSPDKMDVAGAVRAHLDDLISR